jgi:hypothetical protein
LWGSVPQCALAGEAGYDRRRGHDVSSVPATPTYRLRLPHEYYRIKNISK